jgi:transcription antitermination factor NusG
MTLHSPRVLASDLPSCSSDKQWYVVHCQPQRERCAAQNISQRLGLKVYLPEVQCHLRGKVEVSPLFPRYLFVQADIQVTSIHQINRIEGVNRMVAFGDQLFPIPDEVIEALITQVEALNQAGNLPEHSLRQGDPEGSLLDAPELSAGLRMLMELFGRQQKIESDAEAVRSSDQQLPSRPPRRTRGKGRKIRCSVKVSS